MKDNYIKIGNKKHIKIDLAHAIFLRSSVHYQIERSKKKVIDYLQKSKLNLSENDYDANRNKSIIKDITENAINIRKAYEEGQNLDEYVDFVRKELLTKGDIISLEGEFQDKINQISNFFKNCYSNVTDLNGKDLSEGDWNCCFQELIANIIMNLQKETFLEICREAYYKPNDSFKTLFGYIKTNENYYRFYSSYDNKRRVHKINLTIRGVKWNG